MEIVSKTPKGSLETLWQGGYFKTWHTFTDVTQILFENGINYSKPELGLALRRSIFLTRRGQRGKYEYIQRLPAISKEIDDIKNELFSENLLDRIETNFSEEIADLRYNFGKSGTCTAFLLRKILEKMILLVFAKNGLDSKLKDKQDKFIGLEAMIDVASREKINGLHIIMPKTAENVKAAKFLGDTAAHNPLTNVDMKTIIPQMPYIITAYEELANNL